MSGVFSLAFNPITYQWDPRKKSANVRLSDLNSSAKFLTDLNTTMCLGNKRYILGVDSDEWEISIYNDGLVNIIIGVAIPSPAGGTCKVEIDTHFSSLYISCLFAVELKYISEVGAKGGIAKVC